MLSPPTQARCISLVLLTITLVQGGCSTMPSSGPNRAAIQGATTQPGAGVLQIIDVDDRVTSQLIAHQRQQLFSQSLGQQRSPPLEIGLGDTLEVAIWEAPPATLFGSAQVDPRGLSTVRNTTLPEQVVDQSGNIMVPFVGRVRAAGKSTQSVEDEIVRGLRGKANQPQVLVRILRNASTSVTVVGEVANSMRMPLTPSGERLLDALAAAGGVRHPVNKVTVQITRGTGLHTLPLDLVIRDPSQNVPLLAGDVVTLMFQPLSFTALGATGKNEEVNFETQGITLAQALARAGGLADSRSDSRGVFVFRFESEGTLDWPYKPVRTTADGKVPVVYRFDFNQPSSLFVMQNFVMANKDVLYVSNAPAAELQKFLNLVFSMVYPVLTTIQITR